MFRQMKVDIVGMVENMSYSFARTATTKSTFSRAAGAEKTAKQFDIAFLGSVELDSGDSQIGRQRRSVRASGRRFSPCEVTVRVCPQCGGAKWKRSKPAVRKA